MYFSRRDGLSLADINDTPSACVARHRSRVARRAFMQADAFYRRRPKTTAAYRRHGAAQRPPAPRDWCRAWNAITACRRSSVRRGIERRSGHARRGVAPARLRHRQSRVNAGRRLDAVDRGRTSWVSAALYDAGRSTRHRQPWTARRARRADRRDPDAEDERRLLPGRLADMSKARTISRRSGERGGRTIEALHALRPTSTCPSCVMLSTGAG